MKKIIHVLTDTNIGGAGIWLVNFLKSFDRTKFEIIAALPQGSLLIEEIKKLDIKVLEVSGVSDQSFSVGGISAFLKLFKEEKPDIVHCHASLSARIAARLLGIGVVNTRHCLEEKKTGIKKIVYSMVNNCLSDVIIGVSKATCDNLLQDGVKKKKLRLVYNGVLPVRELSDTEREEIKKELNIPTENIVVGIIARLESVKNHKLFLDAAKLILKERNDITFLVVGTGTLEEELKQYTKTLEIEDSVIFCGYQKDITKVLNICDINTLASQKEALSISLIEGMTIGIPAVATDSGGPCEVLEDNAGGIIVKNNSAKEFCDAVLLLAGDKEKRIKMGAKGKKRAEEVFSVTTMAEKIAKIYDEI